MVQGADKKKLCEYILRRGGFWSLRASSCLFRKTDGASSKSASPAQKLVASQQARYPRDRPRDPPSIVFCGPFYYASPDRLVFEVDEREPLILTKCNRALREPDLHVLPSL